jgi:hypothetical protein
MLDMLLRRLTVAEVADLLSRTADTSPLPHLTSPARIAQGRATARTQGLWDRLDDWQPGDIPVLRYSTYRSYQATGERGPGEADRARRVRELARAKLALWLDHPRASVPYLEDVVWAFCDDWTWVSPAHEGRHIDLGAATLAADLAECIALFGDRLAPEVTARLQGELARRIFRPFMDPERADFWWTARHNWNAVCNGSVLRAVLYAGLAPAAAAPLVHTAAQRLTYFVDGFTEDGGCVEGPSYWDYGFGHYLQAAYALWARTAGAVNLMADAKLERVARYPLAVHFAGPHRAAFGDADQGYLSTESCLLVNRFLKVPELLACCRPGPDGTVACGSLHALGLFQGERVGAPPAGDAWLPDLGVATLRGPAPDGVQVSIIAGNNGVNHSHNDVGSFVLYRRGVLWLTDPGRPIYTRDTFSDRRYASVLINAGGHSVPVVNGIEQAAGAAFRGTLRRVGEHGAAVDMTAAYPSGAVHRLLRTVALDPDGQGVRLEDAITLAETPGTVVERFVTFQDVDVAPDGTQVVLRHGGDQLSLTALTPGRFAVEVLAETARETRDGAVLKRVTFTPAASAPELVLSFHMG